MNFTANVTQPSFLERPSFFRPWEDFQTRWRFKYTLPRIQTVTLDGIDLDVSALSAQMKNNLLLGRYEVQERKLVQRYLNADDTVLEVGGAIGFIGLLCQKKLGIKRYTTIEANPNTVILLKKNYALNGIIPNVWNMALSATVGFVALNVGSEFWENSLVGARGNSATLQVPGITLESVVRRLNDEPSALIMDIEGAEQCVNFRELPASVKKIIIELHPNFIGARKTYQIVADLLGLGFHVECEDNGTFCFLRS